MRRIPVSIASCSLVTVALALFPARPAAAAPAAEEEEKSITVGLLLQGQLRLDDGGNIDGRSVSFDPSLRRVRLILSGQVTSLVRFFVETDEPKFGYKGDWSSAFFIQDAWIELAPWEFLQVDVGMVLLPFSHHGSQGATSLLMVDYHADLIKHQPGSHKVWRDIGVLARGELFARHLEYRLAVTNGVESGYGADESTVWPQLRNRMDNPLYTARLAVNVFESEAGAGAGGFFLDGVYLKREGDLLLSPKTILSFGTSMSFQHASTLGGLTPGGEVGAKRDYLALAGDVFFDLPVVEDRTQAITAQANCYYYDYGEAHADTGFGCLFEGGYRWRVWQPVIGVDWYEAFHSADKDLLAIRGGINWWVRGHNTSIKAELGGVRVGEASAPFKLSGVVQAQLLY